MSRLAPALAALLLMTIPLGCSSTMIAAKEKLGYAKREQLVDRVQDARDEQEEAKEQFASALDEFLAVTQTDGGNLEAMYRKLNREYKRSESKASGVSDKIGNVERVANALFREWEGELNEYASADLRARAEEQFHRTRSRYNDLIGAMRRAESKMQPVLVAFGDQVRFLKHNLNARAIASLENNVAALETEIGALIAEMESSIAEANAFIDEMGE